MLVEMIDWGFEEGKTFFEFGYDFRQSNRCLLTYDNLQACLKGSDTCCKPLRETLEKEKDASANFRALRFKAPSIEPWHLRHSGSSSFLSISFFNVKFICCELQIDQPD